MWVTNRRGHTRFARGAVVGGVLPGVLAVVNQRLVERMVVAYETGPTILACGAMLAEIAVVGWLCGRFVESRWGRWVAYVWMWGLVDFVVVPAIVDGIWWGQPMALLAPAMLSVQVVLVAVWAVFGSLRWSIRWPVAGALLALGAGLPLASPAYGPHQVVLVVTSQAAVFLIVCGLLYRLGFRLRVGESCYQRLGAEPLVELNQAQFFVRDVLLWMTLAALLLALARTFVLVSPPEILPLARHEAGVMCLTGLLSGLLLIATLNTMLSRERTLARWGWLGGVGTLAGVLLAVCYYFAFAWRGQWPGVAWHPLLGSAYWYYFLMAKWHLLGWMGLSAAALAAALVFLRGQGYRLCRQPRTS